MAQLQIASKRWISYFSYQYKDIHDHNYSSDIEAINVPEKQITDRVYSDAILNSHTHSVLYGSTFNVNPSHQLSWQYSGIFKDGDSRSAQQELFERIGEIQNIGVNKADNRHSSSHSANIRYSFALDALRKFEISTDYAKSTPRSHSDISRHYVESGKDDIVAIDNNSTADVFSAKTEYSTPFFGADLLMGLRYGHIDSRTTTRNNDNSNVTFLRNDNFAAYATLGRKYKKWGWEAGLRGEFLNDNIQVGGTTLRDGWENNLFPSLEFYTSGLSKVIALSISYSSRIQHPTVSQLNPAASYINSVVTGYGNPLLRSSISHNMELGMTLWRDFSLALIAMYAMNPAIDVGKLDDQGAIAFQPLNVNHAMGYMARASYNKRWGPFSTTLQGGVQLVRTKIPYLGSEITTGRPSWRASIFTDVKLAKNTSLNGGFEYYGRVYDMMTVNEQWNNLTVGLTQYLFKRRLQLSISGSDLLHKNRPDSHSRFEFYETFRHRDYNTRHARFSVRWMFNNYKQRYRTQSASDELSRIN